MAREIEKRRRAGANSQFSDIAAAVANRLGHKSLKSQDAYVRGHGASMILGGLHDDEND